MIFTRKQLLKIYPSTYQLNLALERKALFKVDTGIYSDSEFYNPLEVISIKYNSLIFTLNSAFFYWDLTDVIPEKAYLASKKTNVRIADDSIKQCFVPDRLFLLGKSELNVNGITINIYNRERMLIELVRNKNKLPFDYYKEIIKNYRDTIEDLDGFEIDKYLREYPNGNNIYDKLMLEVF